MRKFVIERVLLPSILDKIDEIAEYSEIPEVDYSKIYIELYNKYLIDNWTPLILNYVCPHKK